MYISGFDIFSIIVLKLLIIVSFNELYNAFENWFSDNHNNEKKVDKITIKRRLIDWQKKSKFSFTEGYNGNERHPKFNLMPLEE